mmetsp:Transcript_33104/g.74817  ORF Transcript_33104/g.74817 Transcript_33104/m.74817 type:complete len:220 (-) Transcript_33104:589-1248(-)
MHMHTHMHHTCTCTCTRTCACNLEPFNVSAIVPGARFIHILLSCTWRYSWQLFVASRINRVPTSLCRKRASYHMSATTDPGCHETAARNRQVPPGSLGTRGGCKRRTRAPPSPRRFAAGWVVIVLSNRGRRSSRTHGNDGAHVALEDPPRKRAYRTIYTVSMTASPPNRYRKQRPSRCTSGLHCAPLGANVRPQTQFARTRAVCFDLGRNLARADDVVG